MAHNPQYSHFWNYPYRADIFVILGNLLCVVCWSWMLLASRAFLNGRWRGYSSLSIECNRAQSTCEWILHNYCWTWPSSIIANLHCLCCYLYLSELAVIRGYHPYTTLTDGQPVTAGHKVYKHAHHSQYCGHTLVVTTCNYWYGITYIK